MTAVKNAPELIPVDATGRRLALIRRGMKGPAVVFETGLGAESDEWDAVQRGVGTFALTCRYDRANRGRSDAAPQPPAVRDFVVDLRALLVTAAIPRPCVLVGHSLGGQIVRLYAHQYPEDVAGLVLVGPMHEDQFERVGPLLPASVPGELETLAQLRRFWATQWRDPTKNQEGVDFVACQTQMRAMGALGDIPLLVLTAGTYPRVAAPRDPGRDCIGRGWTCTKR